MYKGKTIAVVVPAYNEEKLIGDTIVGIPDFVDRIYAINDGSTDGTQKVIESLSKNHRLVGIQHTKNRGVGAAIVTGYKAAKTDGFEISVVMAGDNQMDPGYLSLILDPIVYSKADYVKGDRLSNGEYTKGMTPWRRLGNWMLKWLTRVASGNYRLIDPQDGYTAISHEYLTLLDLDSVFPFYGYCNDLLVRLTVLGARILEVPRPYSYTDKAKSHIKYRTYIPKVSVLLLKDLIWRLKNQKKIKERNKLRK